MEYVLWSAVHMEIPDLDETVRVIWRGWVFGIGGKNKFGELDCFRDQILKQNKSSMSSVEMLASYLW